MAVTDAAAAVSAAFAYDEFGASASEVSSGDGSFLFSGAIGLRRINKTHLFARARTYNEALGRFLSPDPILADLKDSQRSRFPYVRNNPLIRVDPSGLLTEQAYCSDAKLGKPIDDSQRVSSSGLHMEVNIYGAVGPWGKEVSLGTSTSEGYYYVEKDIGGAVIGSGTSVTIGGGINPSDLPTAGDASLTSGLSVSFGGFDAGIDVEWVSKSENGVNWWPKVTTEVTVVHVLNLESDSAGSAAGEAKGSFGFKANVLSYEKVVSVITN